MDKNKEFITSENLTPLFYRDHLVVVCVLVHGTKVLSRGMSICSIKERFDMAKAKNMSLGRAIAALKNKQTSLPIKLFLRFNTTTPKKDMDDNFRSIVTAQFGFKYKSIYLPELTKKEGMLLAKKLAVKV